MEGLLQANAQPGRESCFASFAKEGASFQKGVLCRLPWHECQVMLMRHWCSARSPLGAGRVFLLRGCPAPQVRNSPRPPASSPEGGLQGQPAVLARCIPGMPHVPETEPWAWIRFQEGPLLMQQPGDCRSLLEGWPLRCTVKGSEMSHLCAAACSREAQ